LLWEAQLIITFVIGIRAPQAVIIRIRDVNIGICNW